MPNVGLAMIERCTGLCVHVKCCLRVELCTEYIVPPKAPQHAQHSTNGRLQFRVCTNCNPFAQYTLRAMPLQTT